jgi:hypothetical protein
VFILTVSMSTCKKVGFTSNQELSNTDFVENKLSQGTRNYEPLVKSGDSLSCTPVPAQEVINNSDWTYTDHFYTRSQAIKLNIPVVNIDGSYNLKVYVKDYRRTAECRSNDNKSTVIYGQIIRTVIEIKDFNASIGVDLASIAANGTLNRNTQHFYFYKTGFYNPAIDSIIASVSGKVFDVENYSIYQSVMTNVLNLLRDPKTTFMPQKIGIVKDLDDDEYIVMAPIVSYALTSILKGHSITETRVRFEANNYALSIVDQVYHTLEIPSGDGKPNEEQRLKAKRYLQNIKIRL